jgi:hypothetical protein
MEPRRGLVVAAIAIAPKHHGHLRSDTAKGSFVTGGRRGTEGWKEGSKTRVPSGPIMSRASSRGITPRIIVPSTATSSSPTRTFLPTVQSHWYGRRERRS